MTIDQNEYPLPCIGFICPACSLTVIGSVSLPYFDAELEGITQAEIGRATEVDIHCNCGAVYEVDIVATEFSTGASLRDYPRIDIAIYTPDFEAEYASHIATRYTDDPYGWFERDQHEIQGVRDMAPGHVRALPAFQRMHFISYIALLEAYLCDKLLSLARRDPKVRLTLFQSDPVLKLQKFTASDYLGNPEFLNTLLTKRLQKLHYHQLDVVNDLYTAVLGQSMFPRDDVERSLKRAVLLRHDCVHRNGRSEDGDSTILYAPYVEEVRISIEFLVQHIERLCENRLSN
jgi:hypothetical protein